jgi:acyl-CoA thioester hydrolase
MLIFTLKEIKNREKIIIRTQCTEYTKLGTIRQEMLNEKGQVAAEAEFRFAFFDMRSRKIIPPSEKWLKAIGMD